MYQYEKSRKAQLHEKSFSWFEGIGAFPQQAKKAFLYVQMRCLPISDIYVTRVESYARIGHKRLLMMKEIKVYGGSGKMENTKYDDKFYRLPKRLFKEEQFRSMTNEAKALYMILLDRRCLSECNGDVWRDEYGATFIIFTIKEMMRLLHLGNKKINKILKELEAHNLIYRSHQGLGKPNKIYVYDLLKADNDNWLPKQFKHRKGADK